ncbi:hypothetical protein [Pseudoalteromonas sp. R3]|uniref:hypothetical protein n=1 Tax=Pseudoalteromonas sp. R3 TaxID=1709477 RepID=UPI0006B5C5E8|nr:hypothetical protein [Pseudoalteromonas sp. R3]AZZ96384.1 hypothetical protein ELR70_04140 [Pseudoalteromonas sp. R3]
MAFPLSTFAPDLISDHGLRFIQWLDTFRSYSSVKNLSKMQQQKLQQTEAIAADYLEFVALLSSRYGLNQGVAQRILKRSHDLPLSGTLARHWCASM